MPSLERCEVRALMSADIRVGGSLFQDLNRDGLRDAGDLPIAGADVLLFAADGETLRGRATTAADGSFAFDDQTNLLAGALASGDYVLKAVAPAGLAAWSVNAADVPHVVGLGATRDTVTLGAVASAGGASGSIDFGFVRAASLSGSIFMDSDGDNTFDSSEAPIVGEYVVLSGTAGNGDAIWTYAVTGADGSYRFDGLLPGAYTLQNYRTTGLIAAGAVAGKVGNATRGQATAGDTIAGVTLDSGEAASGYRFAAADTLLSGRVVRDLTGDSYDPGDTPMSGVRVNLYRDVNNNGKLDSGDGSPFAFTTTDAGGRWRFVNPGVGLVFAQEVVPSNYVRTYPLTTTYQDIHVCGCGFEQTGVVFANFQKPSANRLSNITYTVTSNTGTSKTVTDLRGNVKQDDTVTANFTVKPGTPVELSLVSYAAPTSSFSSNNASQQFIYQEQTQTFQPGPHSLTVRVPNSFFQVDFVYGTPIAVFGPANSNIFFTPQGRLISADNGGVRVAGASTLSGHIYVDGNNNGGYNSGEAGLAGVAIQLTGTDFEGNAVDLVVETDSSGTYRFTGVRPSDLLGYTLRVLPNQAALAGYVSADEDAGNYGGQVGDDLIAAILLNFNQNGTGYDFGWRLNA